MIWYEKKSLRRAGRFLSSSLLFLTVLLLAPALFAAAPAESIPAFDPIPDPTHTPRKVVEIQLAALAANDEQNRGIETAFRFASPSNKEVTGPLERFITLFDDPNYAPMLAPVETEFFDIRQNGRVAIQPVRILGADGRQYYYAFVLERQTSGDNTGSWMTSGVQTIIGGPAINDGLSDEFGDI